MGSKIDATPEMMNSIAKELGQKIEEWNSAVQAIYNDYEALKATFEGSARTRFDQIMAADQPKYQKLSEVLNQYKTAILESSNAYVQADTEASSVLKTSEIYNADNECIATNEYENLSS